MFRILWVIFVNLVLAVAMLGSVLLLVAGYKDAREFILPASPSRVSFLPYQDAPWAKQHYREIRELQTRYYDYIGWRRTAYIGQTININDQGYRLAPGQSADPSQSPIHVFGGSTIWGTGAFDAATIPALLTKSTGVSAFNFGESAYTAHQSLNLLMMNYAKGLKPKTVIFYDGVNEVQKCRSEVSAFGSAQEEKIRNLTSPSRLWRLVAASFNISSTAGISDPYDCDTNPEKAERIANLLAEDWIAAKHLAEENGARFIAILQPVSYLGRASIAHLEMNERQKRQFEVLYPLIRAKLAAKAVAYQDFSDAFDGETPLYVDFCHVTPDGNSIIAARIATLLN